ncbi:MAG TPA: SDR family NAD(P)-dependent oxidoreductase [Burkholderiales bacterium]|nr:SDR family NAD(P)-dependent oxidoreductase [Burkholderiales bacterium]
MKELKGRVAAVTGAASGLGRAMALALADEGMHVALADVADTSEVFAQVEARGVSALALKVDVSRGEEVEAFAALVEKDLGPTALVCNNAGVSVHGAAWECSADDWSWVLGVNLWGVIHGVRSFVPRMRARNVGHVVNTASVAGLISPSGMAVYSVSKHAVVALSEVLHHDLRLFGSAVGVSVLCPAYVPTRISESERNRPAGQVSGEKSARTLEQQAMLKKAVASGRLSAEDVARAVVRAVKEERFYILTHPNILGAVRARMEDILEQRAPRDPMSLR